MSFAGAKPVIGNLPVTRHRVVRTAGGRMSLRSRRTMLQQMPRITGVEKDESRKDCCCQAA
jgi:hypothetical protein